MDERASFRPIRALVAGPEAFWTSLASQADFEGRAFGKFVKRHSLFCWLAPVLDDPRAERAFPPEFLDVARRRLEIARGRNVALTAASRDVATAMAAAGADCIFLKGLALAERFYGDPARRHQVDLDLLVPGAGLERALGILGDTGFDVDTDLDTGKPMAARLHRIRHPGRKRVPHAVSVGRDGIELDLHWCLRSRGPRERDEVALWSRRRQAAIAGTPVWTLSDEHTLMFVLVSISYDVRRGRLRAKHFLDLYLMLRQLESAIDWDDFFQARASEGIERVCVNVLTIFLITWECGGELPSLVRALEVRRRLIDLCDEAEAIRLVERRPGNPENRAWRQRVHPPSRVRGIVSRATFDLPRTLSRLGPSGGFQGPLGPS